MEVSQLARYDSNDVLNARFPDQSKLREIITRCLRDIETFVTSQEGAAQRRAASS